jgi:hypothetical protein
MMIYQISYLSDDPNLRAFRKERERKTAEFLSKLGRVKVVAQNYLDSDVPSIPGVEYVRQPKLGPAGARNFALRDFYSSDEDFLFLNDDDVMFYDYYRILNLFDEIKKHPEKFKDVDAFYPIAPQYEPFKNLVYEDSRNLDFWKFAKSPINHPGSQMILRNIKKFKGIEIYQNESLNPGKGTGNEDVEFMLEWLKKGLTWCQLQTWIQKNLGMSKSIVFSEKEERKTGIIQSNLKSLCSLHSDDGLIWDEKKNHPIYKEFNKRWNRTPAEILVKREKPIQFSKNEIPDGGLKKAVQMRMF